MIGLLVLLVQPEDVVAACAAAVRTNLASAEQICIAPRIDLFKPKDAPIARCSDAIEAGRRAGRDGSKLPPVFRDALIKNFEKELAACQAPPPPPTPDKPTTRLWE